jgi:hypothetical protein
MLRRHKEIIVHNNVTRRVAADEETAAWWQKELLFLTAGCNHDEKSFREILRQTMSALRIVGPGLGNRYG